MKAKNTLINPKKIPYNLALIFLTAGASLILGFLSFSGMYALLPILPLAIGAFVLSVAYEGEIYLQNIKGALKKIFKNTYQENTLAKAYLLEHFPQDTKSKEYPQFFKDYKIQLKLLAEFGHKELDKESRQRKKQVTKTLSDMEKWFAQQLFHPNNESGATTSKYSEQLQIWLAKNQQKEWQERLEKRRFHYNLVKILSALSAVFMGLGSTYLIVEAFTIIPFFAAIPFAFWPILILPMAVVAGAAYGLLTFNAITDMINNNTVMKWYHKIRNDLSQGLTVRNVFMATTAVFLSVLAVALTVCTAGTWWTIATNARPLFDWMSRMPSFIMGVINPVVTGVSAIFFNIQNTAESLDIVDETMNSKRSIFQRVYDAIIAGYHHLRATENWLQIVNPFRLIIKLTLTPLRILLFVGHLLSIALTADRMPGVPQIVSMLIALISEGFEDAHYFVGHDHEDAHHHEEGEAAHHHHDLETLLKERLDAAAGHSHDTDIPTWLLKKIASPAYALAALWDFAASQLNSASPLATPQPISLGKAWNKQCGIVTEENVILDAAAKRPSQEWQIEHAVAQIEKYKNKHLNQVTVGSEIAAAKTIALTQLQNEVRNPKAGETLASTLREASQKTVYNQHRLFTQSTEKTATQEFLEELPQRVNAR